MVASAWILACIASALPSADSSLLSGSPIKVGTPSYREPIVEIAPPKLSVGIETRPLGAANVLGGKHPDLFLVNNKESSHPGLFLYQYVSTNAKGTPTFKRRFQLTHPFKGLIPPPGTIVEYNGTVHGFFLVENHIIAHTLFDKTIFGFVERREMHVEGLPRPPISVAYLPESSHRGELVFEIPDRTTHNVAKTLDVGDRYRRTVFNPKDGLAENVPRDSSGTWRVRPGYSSLFGVRLSSVLASPSRSAQKLTATEHDIKYGFCGIAGLTSVEKGEARRSVVVGGHSGHLYIYHGQHRSSGSFSVRPRQPLKSASVHGASSRVLTNPSPCPMPIPYVTQAGHVNLIVGGEGPLQYYKHLGYSKDTGLPLYAQPRAVVEQNAYLYAGSHPVVAISDWDKDGRTDIVAGNAEGRVLIFKNVGTDNDPVFLAGVPLKQSAIEVDANHAGGASIPASLQREICVEQGYQALNGPAEGRYGYATPAVVDWNGDGHPDLVMADSASRHTVYLSVGSGEGAPVTQPPRVLRNDGFDLHGPWRVKPGIARHQGRLLYVSIDDEDDLRAYYRVDNENVKDAGKIQLTNGKPIKTHYLSGGARGRMSIDLVDFDSDGVLDLILGVPAHASVPRLNTGLPSALGLPGGAILFMKGKRSGSGGLPRFASPEVMHNDGHPIFIGREDGSVTTTHMGGSKGPHIVVGEEGGRIVFYHRSHLSCKTYNKFPVKARGAAKQGQVSVAPMTRGAIEAYLNLGAERDADPDPAFAVDDLATKETLAETIMPISTDEASFAGEGTIGAALGVGVGMGVPWTAAFGFAALGLGCGFILVTLRNRMLPYLPRGMRSLVRKDQSEMRDL